MKRFSALVSASRRALMPGLVLLALLAGLATPAWAGPIITIDENGAGFVENGGVTSLPFSVGPDFGPGGLPSVLIYSGLPFAGTQGDVFLTDADLGGLPGDLLRFNGGRHDRLLLG